MKNLLSKKISLVLSGVLICASPLTGLTSCGNDGSIQLANFESYMDDALMDHLSSKYGVQYQWYTVTEMIETKFKDVYDIAIPCGYELVSLYKKGWLEKIDWKQFGVKDQAGNEVNTAQDAMNLFAPPIQDAINQMNTGFRAVEGTPQDFNVLDYGVPYFAQQFMFAYKGTEIDFYKTGTTEKTEQPTWSDIFYTISPNNPKLEPRFRDRRIGMIDDAKSLYDISRIIETSEANPTDTSKWTNQMPADSSISSLVNTYKAITDKAQTNWYTLNTDSGIISRNLADHQDKSYIATLSWSGDALYGALGAEEFDPYSGTELHIKKPYGASLDEIEFMVMNNKNHDTEKGKHVYEVVKEVCLDGCDASVEEISKKVDPEDKDSLFAHWAMQNWDRVNYTPILNSIYQYVVDANSTYWDQYEPDDSARELYTSIIRMTDQSYSKSLFGRTLTTLENSNTHWAWLQSRGKL